VKDAAVGVEPILALTNDPRQVAAEPSLNGRQAALAADN
jgi:hypothetical protein